MSYTEKMKKNFAPTGGSYVKELKPRGGVPYKIRLVPPPDEEDLFYQTFHYHYLAGIEVNDDGEYQIRYDADGKVDYSKGAYVFTGVDYKDDPIAAESQAFYDYFDEVGETDLGKLCKSLYDEIKRKTQWFFHTLAFNAESDKWEYTILVDTSNQAKMAKEIVRHIAEPLYRDVTTRWVMKGTKPDDGDIAKELFDFTEGQDLRIKKKLIGDDNWRYDMQVDLAGERKLSESDLEELDRRVDLKTYKTLVADAAKLQEILDLRRSIYPEEIREIDFASIGTEVDADAVLAAHKKK